MNTTLHVLESVEVDSLKIEMITQKPSDDPYGQGFSGIVANAITADPDVLRRSRELKQSGELIAVTCAGLRVVATIEGIQPTAVLNNVDLRLHVREIDYRGPKEPRITWKRA